MADEKFDRDNKSFLMLKAAELAEQVARLHADLEAGKKVGWDRMYRAIRWLDDANKTRGWTQVFHQCREHGEETRTVKGIEVKYSMIPWENRRVWAPFIVDVYTDLNTKLKEGDMLSILAFNVGKSEYDRKPATGVLSFLRAARAKVESREGDDEKESG